MSVRGSYGLVIDLGRSTAPDFKMCYDTIWGSTQLSCAEGGADFGDFRGTPRIREGRFQEGTLSCDAYTRIEQDSLGYTDLSCAPVLLTLSIRSFEEEAVQTFLKDLAQRLYVQRPYYFGMLGDLTSYYLHQDLIGPEWLDFQRENLSTLFLAEQHPFYSACKMTGALGESKLSELKHFWTEGSESERQQSFKKTLHAYTDRGPSLSLTWESE